MLLPRSFLQWQGDQVPESSLGHRVLTRKEAVVRIQTDIRSPLHRFGEDMRSEPSSQRGRNGFLEEETRRARLVLSVTARGRLEGSSGGRLRERPSRPRASRPCRNQWQERNTSRLAQAGRRRRQTAAPRRRSHSGASGSHRRSPVGLVRLTQSTDVVLFDLRPLPCRRSRRLLLAAARSCGHAVRRGQPATEG